MRHRVSLLDIWIDAVSPIDALVRIDTFVQQRLPRQLVTVNLDFLRLAYSSEEFRYLINSSDLAVADGMPLVWGAQLKSDPLPARVTGIDLVELCAALARERGYRIYLVGGGQGVAPAAAAALRARYPGITIAGTYTPPYGPFDASEEERMVSAIKRARPDLLFVALGAPRQDMWIRRHKDELNVPVSMGVGGALDLLAGRVPRAPRWMQTMGMEWFWRLTREPARLWRRYLVQDLPIFARLIAQCMTTRRSIGPTALHVEHWPTIEAADISLELD